MTVGRAVRNPETGQDYHHIPVRKESEFRRGTFRTFSLPGGEGIKAVGGRLPGHRSLVLQSFLLPRDRFTLRAARDWVADHKPNPGTEAERVFQVWHDFPHREKIPFKMPRGFSRELVVLGECDGIMYASDKWHPGEVEKYIHHFKRRALPLLLYDPRNNILIIPGPPRSGKWRVTKRGLVD